MNAFALCTYVYYNRCDLGWNVMMFPHNDLDLLSDDLQPDLSNLWPS